MILCEKSANRTTQTVQVWHKRNVFAFPCFDFFFTLTDSGTLCHLFSSLKIAFKTQNVSLEVTIEAVKIFRKFQSFFWFSSQSALATVIVCGGHKEVTSFTENKKIKTNTSQATYQGHTLDFSLIFFFFYPICVEQLQFFVRCIYRCLGFSYSTRESGSSYSIFLLAYENVLSQNYKKNGEIWLVTP